jgi:hypothetical protein
MRRHERNMFLVSSNFCLKETAELFFKMHLTLEIENANNQKNESKEQFGPL